MSNLPKIKDLYNDSIELAKSDAFMALMNQPPKPEWVKEHPFIKNYKYIPIERIEFLLKTIFKRYRIEITGQGQSFNGVWVTVRVHYFHPVFAEWDYHDGIGAVQLQLRSQTTEEKQAGTKVMFCPENLSNGAISMAFPIAKTVALKDACDHFGKLFGSDINRKDDITYGLDPYLIPLDEKHPNWMKICEALKTRKTTLEKLKTMYKMEPETETFLTELTF
ncbi:MAG: hypothetical protein BWY27_01557 [Bacteroidetes bacterium ADurb.Bin234]|jgi:hypothetical protein|nr:MAG: hypothetical protein BWY27_01557 [Bacteroidetes bacterium ADurb.Bin234]